MMPLDLGIPKAPFGSSAPANDDVVWRFMWEIRSVNLFLEELCRLRADALGITAPQWMILIALWGLDRGNGVPVNAVSKLMKVDSSFVTTQSKLLEKKGLLRRKPSTSDGRIVEMSLTDRTYKHLAGLSSQQEAIDKLVFGEFNVRGLSEFASRLAGVRERLEKARLKIALDL